MLKLHSRLMAVIVGMFSMAHVAGAEMALSPWQPLNEPGSGGYITDVSVSPHDPSRVLLGGDMLGVGVSSDGGATWQSTFGFRSWEIASFTWHPTDANIVWASTMSGPYVSHDGGVNWEPSRAGMPAIQRWSYSAPIERVLFDPNDTNTLLAFGGSHRRWGAQTHSNFGAVWRSTDGGATWARQSTLTTTGSNPGGGTGINIVAAAYAPGSSSRVYAAGLGQGFYRSTDGGATWTKTNTGLDQSHVERIVVDPNDVETVYVSLGAASAASPGGVYRSTDGGLTWSSIAGNLPLHTGPHINQTANYRSLAIAETPDGSPLLLVGNGTNNPTHGGVYASADGGDTWTKLVGRGDVDTAYPAGINPRVVSINPANPDVMFVANAEYALRSTDGGATWQDVTATAVDGGGYIGTGFSGLVANNVVFNPAKPGQVIVQAMDAGKLWITHNGGASWRRQGHDVNNWFGGNDAVFADEHIYATFGQNGLFYGIGRSTDGGESFTTLSGNGLPAIGTSGQMPYGIHAAVSDPATVWAVVGSNLYRSTNAGNNWTSVATGLNLRWIADDPTGETAFYISSGTQVFHTADGENLSPLGLAGGLPAANRGRMDLDPQGRLYLAAHDGSGSPGHGVWRYDPATSQWTRLLDDAYAVNVAVDPTDPLRIAVATGDNPFHDETAATGVWLSLDGGETWAQHNTGLAMLRGAAIAWNPHVPGELIFGTEGRGFFVTVVPEPASAALLTTGLGGLMLRRRR